MARLSSLAFTFLVVFSLVVSTMEARSLSEDTNEYKNKAAANSLDGSLFLSALPKGKVPASTPSKKGHAFVVDEKLIARRHLIKSDRLLQSVPSPGMGH